MANQLPISRLIHVSVNLTPAGASTQDISTLLILGSSTVIDTFERIRTYSDIAAIASDFGTSAPEYAAAVLWFQQVPQPSQLSIGRWVNAAASGGLRCAPLASADQAIASWQAITTGSFKVAVNGAAAADITGLNFSAAANLNAVAAIIDTALAGGTVVWNATYARFEFSCTATGATSAISFLQAAATGVDISNKLAGRSTSSGAYVFQGQAAETALAATTLYELNYGQHWYALTILAAVDADHLAVAPFIEATNTKHIYGITTQEAGVLVPSDTTNIAYLMKQLAYLRTFTQFSSSNAYAVVSALARLLTVDYNGNSTTITLMYKQEPGIVAEALNSIQVNALESFNANVFTQYDNDTAILERGAMASGVFADIVTGTDWLALNIQTNIYNLLYTSVTKIPQTNAGMQLIATQIGAVLSQAVINGLLAPGVWNSGGFGQLKQGDYLASGFYVYAPNVDTQNQAQRAARQSVPFQIAAKLAGAVHEVSVAILVNQ